LRGKFTVFETLVEKNQEAKMPKKEPRSQDAKTPRCQKRTKKPRCQEAKEESNLNIQKPS